MDQKIIQISNDRYLIKIFKFNFSSPKTLNLQSKNRKYVYILNIEHNLQFEIDTNKNIR